MQPAQQVAFSKVKDLNPAGDDYVASLTDAGNLLFFSATNGWGPVERDTSNGEQAAGDGRPITLNGVVYQKGLGTNAVSDVSVYLGGNCSCGAGILGGGQTHRADVHLQMAHHKLK